MSLRSKWAAGPALAGREDGTYLNRYVTDPAAAGLARPVSIQIWALRYRQSGSDRLEKQPTDPAPAGRRHYYMRDRAPTITQSGESFTTYNAL
jgi:hypothetical protein